MSAAGAIDEARFRTALERACGKFKLDSIHNFQKQTARLVLERTNVVLDAPTGAGKTVGFVLPLFYNWDPDDPDAEGPLPVMLILSPLVALMDEQVRQKYSLEVL